MLERFGNDRLIFHSVGREIDQTTGTKIFKRWNATIARELSDFLNTRSFGETNDPVIRRMDSQDQLSAIVNRALIVFDSGPVGCPNFAQNGAALCHYIRNSKTTADLNQLAARDNYLTTLRECVENEHHSGCIVVHKNGSLTSGETRQQLLAMDFSFPALPSNQVIFEV